MLVGHVIDEVLDASEVLVADLAVEGLLRRAGVRMVFQVGFALPGGGEPSGAVRAGVRPRAVHSQRVAFERLLRTEAATAQRARKAGTLVFSLLPTPGPVDETRSLHNIDESNFHVPQLL